jgi:hypothetical protein
MRVFVPILAICTTNLVEGFTSFLVPGQNFNTQSLFSSKTFPLRVCNARAQKLARTQLFGGSRGLFASTEHGDDDEVKWLPPISGPSVEPTPGATVIPVFPLGSTVYVVFTLPLAFRF